MDRAGNRKEVWVTCPSCRQIYNVETLFWEEERFSQLLLHCPFCHTEFDKKTSPKIYGLRE